MKIFTIIISVPYLDIHHWVGIQTCRSAAWRILPIQMEHLWYHHCPCVTCWTQSDYDQLQCVWSESFACSKLILKLSFLPKKDIVLSFLFFILFGRIFLYSYLTPPLPSVACIQTRQIMGNNESSYWHHCRVHFWSGVLEYHPGCCHLHPIRYWDESLPASVRRLLRHAGSKPLWWNA